MVSIWSKKIIIPTVIIAVLYVVATIYLMNAGLVKDTIFYLPFQGLELSVLAIILLSVSLYVLIRQDNKQIVCEVVAVSK